MKTYDELIEKSEQVRTNELPESNTHVLIGELFTEIVELQKQISKDNDNTFKEKIDKNNITGDFGSSVDKIIHQKAFTDHTQGRVLGKVDIKDLDSLNTLSDLGFYHVFKNNSTIGEMIVTGDNMQHTIIQVLIGNYTVDDGTLNAHVDDKATIVYRIYNLSAPNLNDISRKTWGKWHYLQKSFLKSEFGASVTDTVTQKFFTEQTQNRVLGKVEIGHVFNINAVLDSYSKDSDVGYYIIHDTNKVTWGLLEITSNQGGGFIQQCIKSNISINYKGDIMGQTLQEFSIIKRVYNRNSEQTEDPAPGKWGKWRQYGQNFEVLSETEYENLKRKDSEMFYYTYEEEEEDV